MFSVIFTGKLISGFIYPNFTNLVNKVAISEDNLRHLRLIANCKIPVVVKEKLNEDQANTMKNMLNLVGLEIKLHNDKIDGLLKVFIGADGLTFVNRRCLVNRRGSPYNNQLKPTMDIEINQNIEQKPQTNKRVKRGRRKDDFIDE